MEFVAGIVVPNINAQKKNVINFLFFIPIPPNYIIFKIEII